MPRPDKSDADGLTAQLYERLRGVAEHYFSGQKAQTLQPTALVHEAYLKLATWERSAWRDEEHFCAIAARAMRQILTDRARRRGRGKRRESRTRVTLTGIAADAGDDTIDVLALHEALDRLAELHPRQARLLELRFFAGLTVEQAARALDVSLSTAEQDWRVARAWISRALEDAAEHGSYE